VRTYCTKSVGPRTQMGDSSQVLSAQFLLLNRKRGRIGASYLQTKNNVRFKIIYFLRKLAPSVAIQSNKMRTAGQKQDGALSIPA